MFAAYVSADGLAVDYVAMGASQLFLQYLQAAYALTVRMLGLPASRDGDTLHECVAPGIATLRCLCSRTAVAVVVSCFLFPAPCLLFPASCLLLPAVCALLPSPCFLFHVPIYLLFLLFAANRVFGAWKPCQRPT